jgi:threonine-phosphate decarboxylase
MAELYKTTPDRVMLVNGGDPGLDVLIHYYKHLDVIIRSPTYGAYKTLCERHGVKYKEVTHLDLHNEPNLVIICNPNNPTGDYVDARRLSLDNPQPVFVIDETYIDFAERYTAPHTSICESVIPYGLDNVFVIRSMSKYYGLAGMRVGCIVGNVGQLRHMFNNKNVLDISKLCVLKVLEYKEHYDKCADDVIRNKKRITDVLDEKKIGYVDTPCNFICVSSGNMSVSECLVIAKTHGLIFRDISDRVGCDGMYRVTIGDVFDTDKTVKFIYSL